MRVCPHLLRKNRAGDSGTHFFMIWERFGVILGAILLGLSYSALAARPWLLGLSYAALAARP